MCILERTQLSDRCFANVLTQFMACLFILLTESLAKKDGEFDFELLSHEQPLWHQEGNAKQMAGGSPRDRREHVNPRDLNERVWQEQREQDLVSLFRDLKFG